MLQSAPLLYSIKGAFLITSMLVADALPARLAVFAGLQPFLKKKHK
jgi:hypothetical protein